GDPLDLIPGLKALSVQTDLTPGRNIDDRGKGDPRDAQPVVLGNFFRFIRTTGHQPKQGNIEGTDRGDAPNPCLYELSSCLFHRPARLIDYFHLDIVQEYPVFALADPIEVEGPAQEPDLGLRSGPGDDKGIGTAFILPDQGTVRIGIIV